MVQAKGNYSSGPAPYSAHGFLLRYTLLYNVKTCMYVRSWPTMIYFDRLETVRFSLVRETWSTRAAVMQNTEA